MDNIKKHIDYMTILWYIHGALMDDTWTLGQE